jgi:hypothetical protein
VTVPACILSHCKHFGIFSPLAIQNLLRRQADLLETGRIQVEGSDCPQHGEVGLIAEARRYSSKKQGGCCIVGQRFGSCRNLVKAASVKAVIGKSFVDRRQPETQRRSSMRACGRQICAKRGEHLG